MADDLKSRLWAADSSSSDSSGSESEDETPLVQAAADKKQTFKRWADESSSDDEPAQKRKVVSHTDKRYDQMKERIKILKNHQKVNDFGELITDYEQLLKMIDKLKILVEEEGPPSFFIQAAAGLDVYCEKMHKEHLENKASKGQRLPENKQKAFNTLRSKVKKGNRTWQDLIDKCKEDPDHFKGKEEEEGDSDDAGSDSEDSSGSSKVKSGSDSSSGSSGSDSDSSSDSGSSSGSGSDSDSSDSDSDSSDSENSKSWKSGTDDSDDELDDEAAREKKMIRWLITPEQEKKRAVKKQLEDEDTKGKPKKDKGKGQKTPKQAKEVAEKFGKEEGKKKEYTPEKLMEEINTIAQQRGKRGFDRKEYMKKLEHLEEHTVKQGPRFQLYLLTQMISADFDNTGSAFDSLKLSLWNGARDRVAKMLPLLVESHDLPEETDSQAEATDDQEEDPKSHHRLQELFIVYIEKLDDELHKALQFTIDVYGSEYQDVLANSSKFLVLLKRVYKYFEETKQAQPLGIISMRLMEQLYYRADMLNRAVFEAERYQVPDEEKADWIWPENSKAFMNQLCNHVYSGGKIRRTEIAEGSDNSQTRLHRRATLCQVYHLALHDHFDAARNLIQLGNLHDQAMDSDVHIQILYNRVVAQMGLCAFRLGKITEAHSFLMDVCMHNKARELLAQGLSFQRQMEKTAEQERAEKLRQLPYHMHINLEVLETAHHICAMLLEVPNLAMESVHPDKKRIISRNFRRELDRYDKLPFAGPPENPKEAVVCAARSLQSGDWLTAFLSLEDLKLWEHIDPALPERGLEIKAMIKEKVQVEALRTYLFAYASIYDAFHMDQLVSMFALEPKLVHSVVSKMMMRDEVSAFWDESSKYVLIQPFERTPLQRLALTLAEKGFQAISNNEQLVDQKSGGYGLNARDANNRWEDAGAGQGRGRFGKGMDPKLDIKGKGKGRGRGVARPAGNRGWENARAGAIRGNAPQRGFAAAPNRGWG
jgi:translation initiation factor 3 subunit C